jgi:hypothetical protein
MRTFLPSARATNWLLIVGFLSVGYALYLRYLAIEQPTVGIACAAGLQTWLCSTRALTISLFAHSVFGWTALIAAILNLIRHRIVQRRAQRIVGGAAGAQLCASRTRRRVSASTSDAPQNHSDCQLENPSLNAM